MRIFLPPSLIYIITKSIVNYIKINFLKLNMIINLFSIFLFRFISLFIFKLIKYIYFFIYFTHQFWFPAPSRITYLWYLFINYIFNELKILISYSFSNIIIFMKLFLFIFFNNFLDFFPYIFTASNHIRFYFSLSLRLRIRLILFRIRNH